MPEYELRVVVNGKYHSIHEVYRTKRGEWVQQREAARVAGFSDAELIKQMKLMLEAYEKPRLFVCMNAQGGYEELREESPHD